LKELKRQLKEGWYVFAISVQSNILSSSGVFVLGLFENKTVVGYYSAVERLLKAFLYIFYPITQTIYPYSASKLNNNIYEGRKFIIKVGVITVIISISLAFALIIFSPDLLSIIYGKDYVEYSIIIRILSIWLIFGVINNFIGIQYLSGLGKYEVYIKSFTLSVIVTLFIYIAFTPLISYLGITLGMLFGEITLTLAMIYYIRRHKL
jgi:PST family polysaccharide transporter